MFNTELAQVFTMVNTCFKCGVHHPVWLTPYLAVVFLCTPLAARLCAHSSIYAALRHCAALSTRAGQLSAQLSTQLRRSPHGCQLCTSLPCSALRIAIRLRAGSALCAPNTVLTTRYPPGSAVCATARDLHAALRHSVCDLHAALTALHTSLHIAATLHCLAALSQSLTLSQPLCPSHVVPATRPTAILPLSA